MSVEYQLPQFPLGGSQATLVRWLKRPGDSVSLGDPLLIAVNDRVEIMFPVAERGILEAQLVAEGANAMAGAPVARIAAGPLAVDQGGGAGHEEQPREQPGAIEASLKTLCRATPVARRIAATANIDITSVGGSGPHGRILKSDVLAAIESLGESMVPGSLLVAVGDRQRTTDDGPWPEPGRRQQTADETYLMPLSSMRRAIAAHMVRSRATSPHALTAMEVDMGQVAAMRAHQRSSFARRGIDLTYTACIALAAVEALLRHPLLNSSWSEAGIVLRRRVHLGVAVALPDGLITPVIREAQDLNLRGMARAVADVAARARAGGLRPGEASGGTFTLTNPGAGSLWFGTPIIAQPQGAILGVGTVRKRPLVVAEASVDRIAVRPTALLTLAYDARVLDQCHADAFLCDVKNLLEHFDP